MIQPEEAEATEAADATNATDAIEALTSDHAPESRAHVRKHKKKQASQSRMSYQALD